MAWSIHSIGELDKQQFLAWHELLESKTGINFEQHESILAHGLKRRMREVDCHDYDQYLAKITREDGGETEWVALLNSLTVGETRFFRHQATFDYLALYLRNFLNANPDQNSLQLWSVGCSSGEEAYSMALVVNRVLKEFEQPMYYGITGSDICLAALAEARRGIYSQQKLKSVFKQYDPDDYIDNALSAPGYSQFSSFVRRRMCFVQTNLMALEEALFGNMDVIFCQNVLIYFRRERQLEVLNQLVKRLRPGGLLVVGVGEVNQWNHADLQRVPHDEIQAYIKQKTEQEQVVL